MQLTKNFALVEFACHDGTAVPEALIPKTQQIAEALEVIREACGNQPVTIISGYRSPAYNTKIDGAAKSRHMKGDAADIRVKGMKPPAVADVCERLQREGKIPMGGVGRYSTFTHVDVRGYVSRWEG